MRLFGLFRTMTAMARDLADKTYLVTGANTGIGKVTALELAKRGAHVFLACRSKDKTDPVVAEINGTVGADRAEFLALDLASLESVRSCATAFLDRGVPLHGLINNAGLVTRGSTKEGFELIFGVNHLGHYLLTRLLLDKIKASGPARIVNVASAAHYRAKGIDWAAQQKPTKSITGFHEYMVSKLANVLFTQELARRLAGTNVTTYAVHPGGVASDVWRRVPNPIRWLMLKAMLTVEQGAVSSLKAATDPALATESGRYYTTFGKEKAASPRATPELAKELWDKSAAWVGLEP